MFHQMDIDANGVLSVSEITQALQTDAEFARLTGVSRDGKAISPIAAGLISKELHKTIDEEFGNADGVVAPDEFVIWCRRLITRQQQQQPNALATAPSAERAAPRPEQGKKRSVFGGGLFGGGGGGKAPGRAEAKLYALQAMLRQDVVGDLERLLMSASVAPNEDKPRLYHEGCCAVLATVRRLADAEEYQSPGGGASGSEQEKSEAEALELQTLRRDLSTVRISLAEAQTAREEAEHQLRQLTQQRERKKSWF